MIRSLRTGILLTVIYYYSRELYLQIGTICSTDWSPGIISVSTWELAIQTNAGLQVSYLSLHENSPYRRMLVSRYHICLCMRTHRTGECWSLGMISVSAWELTVQTNAGLQVSYLSLHENSPYRRMLVSRYHICLCMRTHRTDECWSPGIISVSKWELTVQTNTGLQVSYMSLHENSPYRRMLLSTSPSEFLATHRYGPRSLAIMFLMTRTISTSNRDLVIIFTSHLSLEITISPGTKRRLL
jgi:RNase P/RNase MRP subunit p30